MILTVLALASVVPIFAVDGRALFENNCAACHGLDGRAKTPQGKKLKAHDLRESKYTDAEIEHQIREGKKNAAGVQVMPAFGQELKDEQIKAVIAYVKAFRSASRSSR